MQDTFARATHSAYAAARPSARATIGYLVYKGYPIVACRAQPSGRVRCASRGILHTKVSCLQPFVMWGDLEPALKIGRFRKILKFECTFLNDLYLSKEHVYI